MTRSDPPPSAAPLRSDRIYGAVALIMIALAAFFALRGGSEDGAAAGAPVPTLTILEPAAGSSPAQPVSLLFDAGTRLQPGPAGWSSGGRHVHVRVGSTELMADGGDIQPDAGTRYRWVLPRLPAGEQTVQLFWSDAAHQAIRSGSSAPVRLTLP